MPVKIVYVKKCIQVGQIFSRIFLVRYPTWNSGKRTLASATEKLDGFQRFFRLTNSLQRSAFFKPLIINFGTKRRREGGLESYYHRAYATKICPRDRNKKLELRVVAKTRFYHFSPALSACNYVWLGTRFSKLYSSHTILKNFEN